MLVQARQFGAKIGSRCLVARGHHGLHCRRRSIWMTGGKWRIGIVFEAKLDRLSDRISRNLGYDPEAKIDPGCHAARRDDISVLDHAAFFMRCADERQQLGKGPVIPTVGTPDSCCRCGISSASGS